jgi:hypothetical protein
MLINGRDLEKLYRIAKARSGDPTKPALAGVKIEPHAQGCNAAATDGFVLACGFLEATDAQGCIVPDEVIRFMKPAHFGHGVSMLEAVDNGSLRNWTYTRGSEKNVYTQCINDLKYPSWQKVIPCKDAMLGLSRCPTQGYSYSAYIKANDVLGSKKYPFSLCHSLMSKSGVGVAEKDGILFIAMPDSFTDDWEVGPKLAILDNAREMGLIPYPELPVKDEVAV